jgi:hypothetical protein
VGKFGHSSLKWVQNCGHFEVFGLFKEPSKIYAGSGHIQHHFVWLERLRVPTKKLQRLLIVCNSANQDLLLAHRTACERQGSGFGNRAARQLGQLGPGKGIFYGHEFGVARRAIFHEFDLARWAIFAW